MEKLEDRRLMTAVSAVAPYNGQQNFAVAANLTVTFDSTMLASSISSSTIQLRDSSNNVVASTVTYDATTRTATIDPTANLASSANYYTIKVLGGASGVKNSLGTAMATDSTSQFTTLAPTINESTVFSGLNNPSNIEFSPDGRVFVAERRGVIKMFASLTATTPTVVADIRTQVHNYWDRGLLGMAIDPKFTTGRPYLYVLYTYDGDIGGAAPKWGTANTDTDAGASDGSATVSCRLSRLTITNNVMTAETVLIHDWQSQFPSHSIGDLKFGPDGNLYASAGDGASFGSVDYGNFGNPFSDPTNEGGALRSQDLLSPGDSTSLDGSIIRINPDTGAAASGNPLATSGNDANAKRIIAEGLRNPFRFTFRPGTNEIWIGDVGWNTYEEINRITDVTSSTKLNNFGWPMYEGYLKQPGYDAANLPLLENFYNSGATPDMPYFAYNHNEKVVPNSAEPTGGSSPTGAAFYSGAGTLPTAYNGAFFFADYSRKTIYVFYVGPDGQVNPASRQLFKSTNAGAVELQVGPNGDLFYVDMNGGRIQKFTGPLTNQPPTAVISADKTSGALPLTINFNGSSSFDPNPGQALTYSWDLDGDGTFGDSTVANPTFTYTTAGAKTVQLRVSDTAGATGTASFAIFPGNNAPAPFINTPTSTTLFKVGDTINFSGGATDTEDGTLAASKLQWDIVLVHGNSIDPTNTHTHNLQSFSGVTSGSFVAPSHEYPSWLEIRLTATDSTGLVTTTVRRVDPVVAALTFASNVSGVTLTHNSDTVAAPFSRSVIAGSSNVISAPSQTIGGVTYVFNSWSDGGAQTHTIFPGGNTTYTANYVAIPVGTGITGAYYANNALTGSPTLTRKDASINFSWGANSPGTGVPVDNFSARWTGQIFLPAGGVYTFTTTTDDGVRLFVGGNLIIDHFAAQAATAWTGTFTAPAAGLYDLKMEYQELTGGASAKLAYAGPGVTTGVVPTAALYPASAPNAPSSLAVTATTASSIALIWTDNALNETGFTLERSTTSAFTTVVAFSLAANTTTFTDTALAAGTTYYYRVRSVGTYASSANVSTSGTTAAVATTPVKVQGYVLGTAGSYGGGSNTIDKVFDGDTTSFFDAPEATNGNGVWAGFDLGTNFKIDRVRFFPRADWADRVVGGKFQGSATADFATTTDLFTITTTPADGAWTQQDLSVATPFRYVRFLSPNGGWGNIAEVEFYSTTAVTLPAAPTGLSATNISPTQVKLNWTDASKNEAMFRIERSLAGGAWQLIDVVPANIATYTDATLSPGTAYSYRVLAVNTVGISAASNVATGTTTTNTNLVKLGGTVIGTAGAYSGGANTRDKVFDGKIATYFDGPQADGVWAGLDLGTATQIAQIRFAPRAGWGSRMIGGKFQASNSATFSTGVVDLFTVSAKPADNAYVTQPIADTGSYRYVRYLSPNGSWGNIAEAEFYGSTAVTPGDGLTANYYDSLDFSGPAVTRVDPNVDFDFGVDVPVAGVDKDEFTVRWTGQIRADFTQAYTFSLLADNGVRLWVNNVLLIDQWLDAAAEYTAAPINLTAGTKYDIKLEYFDKYGGAEVHLSWTGASTPKQVVPQANLYSTAAIQSLAASQAPPAKSTTTTMTTNTFSTTRIATQVLV